MGDRFTDACTHEERARILARLPQTGPFKFIDEIVELSDAHIAAHYRFRGDEWFYAGHFPGDPVTPGVILIEAMAQAGLVALGLYLAEKEGQGGNFTTLFSDCAIEFLAVVRPPAKIFVSAEKIYFRKNKVKSKVDLRLEDGTLAATGTVSGMGVLLI